MKNPTNTAALAGHQTDEKGTYNDSRTTVKDAVLSHLKSGKSLTPLEAWIKFGTSRLGAIVHKLRKQGYAIQTDIIEVKAGTGKQTEHNAHIASYSLLGGSQ
jgi:hypothetical protein